ncbi:MAG TPA: sigma-70 family RNA polymerase sigma factor [Chthonomonadaceae bacterium]|nr:sigma-70 family RNA polymerase sigma factor [Chthonomonadaceae bacterium]
MTDMHHSKRAAEKFEALLEPILGAAYGTAYHMTHNREEAEDLVQEAAVLAFHAFDTFQEGSNFKAWFFKIMINRCRANYRKRRRELEIAPLDDAPDLYLYIETSNAGLQARNTNPAALVINKMSEEQIEAAIQALPEEYRIVSVLYFMEEISYQEIADILDCPVGTVRSRLHRGRKLLQKALWQVAQEHHVVAALGAEKEGQLR